MIFKNFLSINHLSTSNEIYKNIKENQNIKDKKYE